MENIATTGKISGRREILSLELIENTRRSMERHDVYDRWQGIHGGGDEKTGEVVHVRLILCHQWILCCSHYCQIERLSMPNSVTSLNSLRVEVVKLRVTFKCL